MYKETFQFTFKMWEIYEKIFNLVRTEAFDRGQCEQMQMIDTIAPVPTQQLLLQHMIRTAALVTSQVQVQDKKCICQEISQNARYYWGYILLSINI